MAEIRNAFTNLAKSDLTLATPSHKVKSLVGASLLFQLAISNPNEPIHVEAPQNAQPYPRS